MNFFLKNVYFLKFIEYFSYFIDKNRKKTFQKTLSFVIKSLEIFT